MSDTSKQVLFEEKQRFRQPLLWVVLLGLSLLITYGLIRQVFLGIDFGSKPAPIYRPVLDYGSYGINNGARGKPFNVYGKKGVKLWFKSDRPLLIGSQRSDELCRILKDKIG